MITPDDGVAKKNSGMKSGYWLAPRAGVAAFTDFVSVPPYFKIVISATVNLGCFKSADDTFSIVPVQTAYRRSRSSRHAWHSMVMYRYATTVTLTLPPHFTCQRCGVAEGI